MKRFIYKILDLLTLGKGIRKTYHGYSIKLPTRYFKYFPADYEEQNFNFLQQHTQQGSVVFDIGAHIGLFAAIAAKIVGDKGMIFAFEPTPATQILLRKTIAINKMNHIVEPVAKAVSNAEGSITFYASEHEGDNSNSLVSYKNDRQLKGIEVPLTSVDIFVKQKQLSGVSFIKIDVEGAEYDAIRGAANTILTYKPAMILALHPLAISAKGDTLAGIYDFVISCNYTILLNDKEISKNDFCAATELFDVHLLPIK